MNVGAGLFGQHLHVSLRDELWLDDGANDDHGAYQPDVTSYDYDSVLDESGKPTKKYFAFRELIAKATGVTPPAVPKVDAPMSAPTVRMTESASLWTICRNRFTRSSR